MSMRDPASPWATFPPVAPLQTDFTLSLGPVFSLLYLIRSLHSFFKASFQSSLLSLKIFLICQPYMISPVPLNHVFLFEIYLLLSFQKGLGHSSFPTYVSNVTQVTGPVSALREFSCPGLTPYHHLRGDARALLIS